jgi:c(7)-type cytochrome triheme protein
LKRKRLFTRVMLISVVLVSIVLIDKGAESKSIKEYSPLYRGIKSPDVYGSMILDSYSGGERTMPAVVFPHWLHRTKFTCKVCHNDIGFPMQAGSTDIKMSDIFAGKYCGQCHNGEVAFAPTTCNRCHSLGEVVQENSDIKEVLKDLPKSEFGNMVNWVKALEEGHIVPKASMDGKEEMFVLDKDIELPVTKFLPRPPDVLYPHKAHTEWLHCGSCHPKVFNMKAGGNPDMSMLKIISGRYCGVCHGKVAFPLENCFSCHSQPIVPPEKIPGITVPSDETPKKESTDKK